MNKKKVKILSKVSATFPDTGEFIEKKLGEVCLREKISVKDVNSFFLVSPDQ